MAAAEPTKPSNQTPSASGDVCGRGANGRQFRDGRRDSRHRESAAAAQGRMGLRRRCRCQAQRAHTARGEREPDRESNRDRADAADCRECPKRRAGAARRAHRPRVRAGQWLLRQERESPQSTAARRATGRRARSVRAPPPSGASGGAASFGGRGPVDEEARPSDRDIADDAGQYSFPFAVSPARPTRATFRPIGSRRPCFPSKHHHSERPLTEN